MNIKPINPYWIIKELEVENEKLKEENESLKAKLKEIQNE